MKTFRSINMFAFNNYARDDIGCYGTAILGLCLLSGKTMRSRGISEPRNMGWMCLIALIFNDAGEAPAK